VRRRDRLTTVQPPPPIRDVHDVDLLALRPDGPPRLLDVAADAGTDPALRARAMRALAQVDSRNVRRVARTDARPGRRVWAARSLLWRGAAEGARILVGIALNRTLEIDDRAAAARALLSDASLVGPAPLACLATCTDLLRPQRVIALDLLGARAASDDAALEALCTIATDRTVTPPCRAAAAARILARDPDGRVPHAVLTALAADTEIDTWLRHGAVRRLGARDHAELVLDEDADPEIRVWALPRAFTTGEENRDRLERAAVALALDGGLDPELRLRALNALAEAAPSPRPLLKLVERAETEPGAVPDGFAEHAAGRVAEMLERAPDGPALVLLLAPGLPERIRAVAMERLLRTRPRGTARLLRELVLGADTPDGTRGLAVAALAGRPVAEPLLSLVADGRLDRATWLPVALREPAAGVALAWDLVQDPRCGPGERSAVIADLCAAGARPPPGLLDRLLADLPQWDPARPHLAAELARRDRTAGKALLRGLMLAAGAPSELRLEAARRLHVHGDEGATAHLHAVAADGREALPARLVAAKALGRPDVWRLLAGERRVMKRARDEVSEGLARSLGGDVRPLPVPPSPPMRLMRPAIARAAGAFDAVRRAVMASWDFVAAGLRRARSKMPYAEIRSRREPLPPLENLDGASPSELLAACDRLMEAIDREEDVLRQGPGAEPLPGLLSRATRRSGPPGEGEVVEA
jgi:hypothetical protein